VRAFDNCGVRERWRPELGVSLEGCAGAGKLHLFPPRLGDHKLTYPHDQPS
jgi:hypothetical protein